MYIHKLQLPTYSQQGRGFKHHWCKSKGYHLSFWTKFTKSLCHCQVKPSSAWNFSLRPAVHFWKRPTRKVNGHGLLKNPGEVMNHSMNHSMNPFFSKTKCRFCIFCWYKFAAPCGCKIPSPQIVVPRGALGSHTSIQATCPSACNSHPNRHRLRMASSLVD